MKDITNEPGRRSQKKRGRRAKYPWADWFSQDRRALIVYGEDYTCKTESMKIQLYMNAPKFGGSVSDIDVGEDMFGNETIEFTFKLDAHTTAVRELERVNTPLPLQEEEETSTESLTDYPIDFDDLPIGRHFTPSSLNKDLTDRNFDGLTDDKIEGGWGPR
jgi:hypothetical protein